VQRWLNGTMLEALELQKAAAKSSLVVVPDKTLQDRRPPHAINQAEA
jgi:hypothetical protein